MIEVLERGRRLSLSFEDLMKYHGPGPGGVAHAWSTAWRARSAAVPWNASSFGSAIGGASPRWRFAMADRVMSQPARDVYDATDPDE